MTQTTHASTISLGNNIPKINSKEEGQKMNLLKLKSDRT